MTKWTIPGALLLFARHCSLFLFTSFFFNQNRLIYMQTDDYSNCRLWMTDIRSSWFSLVIFLDKPDSCRSNMNSCSNATWGRWRPFGFKLLSVKWRWQLPEVWQSSFNTCSRSSYHRNKVRIKNLRNKTINMYPVQVENIWTVYDLLNPNTGLCVAMLHWVYLCVFMFPGQTHKAHRTPSTHTYKYLHHQSR